MTALWLTAGCLPGLQMHMHMLFLKAPCSPMSCVYPGMASPVCMVGCQGDISTAHKSPSAHGHACTPSDSIRQDLWLATQGARGQQPEQAPETTSADLQNHPGTGHPWLHQASRRKMLCLLLACSLQYRSSSCLVRHMTTLLSSAKHSQEHVQKRIHHTHMQVRSAWSPAVSSATCQLA